MGLEFGAHQRQKLQCDSPIPDVVLERNFLWNGVTDYAMASQLVKSEISLPLVLRWLLPSDAPPNRQYPPLKSLDLKLFLRRFF